MKFAIFKNPDGGYVFWPANNTLSLNFRACLARYGNPSEYTFSQGFGTMPATWRGKPLSEANVVYDDHDPASGWAMDATVVE